MESRCDVTGSMISLIDWREEEGSWLWRDETVQGEKWQGETRRGRGMNNAVSIWMCRLSQRDDRPIPIERVNYHYQPINVVIWCWIISRISHYFSIRRLQTRAWSASLYEFLRWQYRRKNDKNDGRIFVEKNSWARKNREMMISLQHNNVPLVRIWTFMITIQPFIVEPRRFSGAGNLSLFRDRTTTVLNLE